MAIEEKWHVVEARRDDGAPAVFRIRELAPQLDQPTIFVVEVPYAITALSKLPDAAAYRRLAAFEEQWLTPAATTLAWTLVAAKIEDGSCFLYLYGNSETTPMIERLSPFDASLGFFHETDPTWDEYGALKELLDQANAMPQPEPDPEPATKPPAKKPTARKQPAKNRPAKKAAPVRKLPAKKPTAKKAAPAKKLPAKKRPAKKQRR